MNNVNKQLAWTNDAPVVRDIPSRPAIRPEDGLPAVPHSKDVRVSVQLDEPTELLGESPCMGEFREKVRQVAAIPSTVLVTGESGTGKELVVRALHRSSPRRDGPLVTVNASALPEHLFESELFGHLRGAFTGAHTSRAGLFASASGGTLFLDEVGELAPALQAKLLRALEERRIRPVGSSSEVAVDVRVIAATNRNLSALVDADRFRQDLFYRLNVIDLEIPPLRERGDDVLLLARHFLRRYAHRANKAVTGLASPTAARLLAYRWPGNVRELQNAIERAVALTRRSELLVEDLPPQVRQAPSEVALPIALDDRELPPLKEVERRYVERVLAAVGGNKTAAARILQVSRKTLQRRESAPSEASCQTLVEKG